MASSPTVLLEFYAPWCRHCVEFEGVYRNIGNSLAASNVRVGKVDSAVNQALAARFAVHSIPSLFVIEGDEAWHYEGLMSHDSIVQYVKSGHRRFNALPMWESPMGPFGKFKGILVQLGIKLHATLSNVQKWTGLSSFWAMVVSILLLATVALIFVFSAVYLTL